MGYEPRPTHPSKTGSINRKLAAIAKRTLRLVNAMTQPLPYLPLRAERKHIDQRVTWWSRQPSFSHHEGPVGRGCHLETLQPYVGDLKTETLHPRPGMNRPPWQWSSDQGTVMCNESRPDTLTLHLLLEPQEGTSPPTCLLENLVGGPGVHQAWLASPVH